MLDWHTAPALLSILIASHDEQAVTALTALLTSEGHVVHSVRDQDQVLVAVQRHRPDVCIIYLDIAKRDPYAVAPALRSLPPSRRPFLIAISSGFPGANDALLARNAGFDHFVTNAADTMSLLQFINGIGTRHRIKKR